MPAIYSSASIYVAPTIYESLGISILEAMSCERAVVTTNVGGIPEIITSRHDGLLVAPQNHKELANAILTVLYDDTLAIKLGEEARKTVMENFTIGQTTEKTTKLYRKIVESNN